MTVIAQGPMGVVREFPPQGDPVRRGTARFMGMPSYASCPYTAEYDAQLADQALEKYSGATIGLLGRAALSFALGDYLEHAMLVEDDGAAGLYSELGGTCVLGQASQEMKDEFALVLEAQRFTLARMKPGAKCSEIFAEYNAFMRQNKRPEEKRLHSHGQGYDMVERPLIRHDETMTIQKNMNMVCHPTYVTERT